MHFATQENLFSCTEFMNDEIIKHEVYQACNAWILELSHHEFATQENLFSCAEFMNDEIINHEVRQMQCLDFGVIISCISLQAYKCALAEPFFLLCKKICSFIRKINCRFCCRLLFFLAHYFKKEFLL